MDIEWCYITIVYPYADIIIVEEIGAAYFQLLLPQKIAGSHNNSAY